MHRNAIWISFFLIVVAVSIWFVVSAGYDLIRYYQFNTQVPITVEKQEVKEVGANDYRIEIAYSYTFEGKNYEGVEQLSEIYPNPWAAHRALEKFKEQKAYVWINTKAPETPRIEKQFPYKAAVSAAVLIGLVIYFFIIGLYVGVRNERGR